MDELDRFDHKILTHLTNDARMTVTELARRVGLSKTPCQIRMKRLEESGYIRGYTALLDHTKLNAGHIAFVQVTLNDTTTKALAAFNAAVSSLPEIEQCHMIAGGFDYLLKVRTADIAAYRRILGESISTLPHVSHTSTFVVMESVKDPVG
ncbi:MAG: Lrp/AsnC ligand binding domain-containing protein [Pseudomonadota bacterium]